MTDNRKIVKATIYSFLFGQRELLVELDTGLEERLFSWYVDELEFSEAEFIGMTVAEAYELRHRRDVEYLQTPA